MKKLLFIFTLAFIFTSCINRPAGRLQRMKNPIIVIASVPETKEKIGSITLRDSKGIIETFTTIETTGNALINTYKSGDTIK